MFKRRGKRNWLTLAGRSFWPRGGWVRAASYVWHRLRRIPDPPHKVARGIAAGMFASFTPLFGFHFILAGSIAWAIRGSVLAGLMTTLVGNPLTFPLIAGISMTVGNWMLGRESSLPVGEILGSFGRASAELWHNFTTLFTAAPAHWDGLAAFLDRVFLPYLIGGLAPGFLAALGAYFLSEPIVEIYQNRRRRDLSAKKWKRAAPVRAEDQPE